jgi:cytochrome b561
MNTPTRTRFTLFSRLLHWTMAAMVLAMFGIGMAMVTSLGNYHALVSLHRPLGLAILVLVVVRFVNRLMNPPPPLPATVSRVERFAATAGEYTMYALMFLLPLVGWGMLSAAHYPIVLGGIVRLPEIAPHSAQLFAVLRSAHTVLAYLFFLTFLAHFAAVLFHQLVVRDDFLKRMTLGTDRPAADRAALAPSTGQ